jgi:hypothetical protein
VERKLSVPAIEPGSSSPYPVATLLYVQITHFNSASGPEAGLLRWTNPAGIQILIDFLCNPILFAICTGTVSKLCINVYSGM